MKCFKFSVTSFLIDLEIETLNDFCQSGEKKSMLEQKSTAIFCNFSSSNQLGHSSACLKRQENKGSIWAL